MKVSIDTNVLLDFIMQDRVGHINAQKLFKLILRGKAECDITIQSILDAAYIYGRSPDYDRISFNRIITMLMNRVNVSAIDYFELKDALANDNKDIEDNAQLSHSWYAGCEFFVTNDRIILNRELPSPLAAITPQAFLEQCIED